MIARYAVSAVILGAATFVAYIVARVVFLGKEAVEIPSVIFAIFFSFVFLVALVHVLSGK